MADSLPSASGVAALSASGITFLSASLVALVIGLAPTSSTASLLIWPYLVWVSFAAWLNWRIVRLNPRTGSLAQQLQQR